MAFCGLSGLNKGKILLDPGLRKKIDSDYDKTFLQVPYLSRKENYKIGY